MYESEGFRRQITPSRPLAFGVTPDGMLVALVVQVTHGIPRVLPQIPLHAIIADEDKLAGVEYYDAAHTVRCLPRDVVERALRTACPAVAWSKNLRVP